ncbi:protease [Vulcanibacillus modesticaldus]|uniref:Protease n=1 Tax=Vulcanibacillus modesticaldus TaxID=337097 RepID=A0A1D2YTJ2_9BACI|nr:NfeD family protein [Vulcanibacillus modesticaldus]OEF99030.1 protease [Vulcanibacillus modesticaldus]
MIELYWGSLIFGVIFTILVLIFGDILNGILDGVISAISIDGVGFLQPMVIVGGLTSFGAAGILLTEYTDLEGIPILFLSVIISVFISVIVFFGYVKPMSNAENSSMFSINDLIGKVGEVIITIPKDGYGEILVKVGAGNTNQIAASYDNEEIITGTRVVVIDIKDNVLYVSRFENI